MISVLAGITATIITLPLVGVVVIFLFCRYFLKNNQSALLMTADVSTILFIFATHHIILVLLDKSYMWAIVLIMGLILLLFVGIHWKVKHEIVAMKILKGFWRFTFLFFFLSYFILIITGTIYRAFEATL